MLVKKGARASLTRNDSMEDSPDQWGKVETDMSAATTGGGTGGTGGTAPLQRWEYTLEQTVRWANDALKESPGRRGRQLLTRLAPEVTLDLMRDVAER